MSLRLIPGVLCSFYAEIRRYCATWSVLLGEGLQADGKQEGNENNYSTILEYIYNGGKK